MPRIADELSTEYIAEFLRGLGLDPENVFAFYYSRGRLVVERYRRNADGSLRFGPIYPETHETHHYVQDGE